MNAIMREHGATACQDLHERAHMYQYMAICPDVCKCNPPGFIKIDQIYTPLDIECWPYLVEMNCYIKMACKLSKAKDVGKNASNLEFILNYLDLMGPQVRGFGCKDMALDAFYQKIPNSGNDRRLREGRLCSPENGV